MLITFQTAADGDFEALLALRIAAMRESLERLGRFDLERARARFRASFDAKCTRHVVEDAERVGFVAVRSRGDGILLDHLYVHPRAQRRGIGAEVLRRVIEDANAAMQPLFVTALRESEANRFYQRAGFVAMGETEWDVHYRRDPAAIA